MTRSIGWGILGAGHAAHLFAQGLRSVRDARLVSVASRSKARAQHFADGFQVRHWATDYSSVCNHQAVDVVYVATPNHCHRQHVLQCLEAGKAVLCEKPFATSFREAQEMVAVARERQLFCMEAMWMRFIPLMRRLGAWIGQLGDVRLLTSQLGHPFCYEPEKRLFNAELGGGATLDLGVYPVSLAVQLFGEPLEVQAQGSIAPSGVDEQAAILLRFAEQRIASLSISLRSEGTNDAVILGSRGRIHLHAPLYCCERLSMASFGESSLDMPGAPGWISRVKAYPPLAPWVRRVGEMARHILPREKKIIVRYSSNGFNHEAEEVVRCLRAGHLESEVMPLDETLAVARTLDAIRDRLTMQGRL